MSFYTAKTTLVTGGTGFLGSHVVEALLHQGARVRVATRRPRTDLSQDVETLVCDLTDSEQCRAAARGAGYIFHLAAFGWGLGANVRAQPELFTKNALINTNMLDAAYKEGVERYLLTSSSAIYDGGSSVLDDSIPWRSDPHPSEFSFGWAKRMAELQARVYVEFYGMKIAIVRPSNPYGPRDNFDLKRSHVIPALIRRALAREHPFAVWGTGNAVRSFVYVGDVAEAMLLALERYAVGDPINAASAERTSIASLTRLILELCGFEEATIEFNTSKPEGHPGKFPTITKAQEKIGFAAQTGLRAGLTETIRWYCQNEAVVAHR